MLLENVYKAASLKRGIEEGLKAIEEIEDYPLYRLIFQRVHGRSIEIKAENEQTNYAIKQLLVMGLRAEIQAKEVELSTLL